MDYICSECGKKISMELWKQMFHYGVVLSEDDYLAWVDKHIHKCNKNKDRYCNFQSQDNEYPWKL